MVGSFEPLELDALYDALANERRRSCIETLAAMDPPVPVDDLAARIAADLGDDDPETLKESTYISLIQSHLPKLDDFGIVEYDESAKLVTPGPAFEEAHDCLRFHGYQEPGDDDRRYLLALSGSTTLGLVVALGLPGVQLPVLLGVALVQAGALVVVFL